MKKKGYIIGGAIIFLMIFQMMYVFAGNLVHEIVGIALFVLIAIHIYLKRKVLLAMFKSGTKGWFRASKILIILLTISIIILIITSVAVSRTLFPFVGFKGSVTLHTWFATLCLTLAVVHSCIPAIRVAGNRKRAVIISVVLTIAAFSIGYFGVPYVDRHFKTVNIQRDYSEIDAIEGAQERRVLCVYFTRVGNTDFDENVDAVSGASLLINNGELAGNTQILATMVEKATGCDTRAITLTGDKYPSSYNDTISVAGEEIKSKARPEIEQIDISEYDTVILIYPLWWGTIPNPVATFLEDNEWNSKELWVIATQGSSGYGTSCKDIEEIICQKISNVGPSIYCDDIPDAQDEIINWIKESL